MSVIPTKGALDSSLPPSVAHLLDLEALRTANGMRAVVDWIERASDPGKQLKILSRAPDMLALILSQNYSRLLPLLERELLDPFPSERDLVVPTDPQTYATSVASPVLIALAEHFRTLSAPSSIDAKLYNAHNLEVPLIDLAMEAVILIAKDDRARPGFDWGAAKAACESLKTKLPETDEEAENLSADFIMSLRKAVEFYLGVLGNKEMAQRIRENVYRMVEAPDPSLLPIPRHPLAEAIDVTAAAKVVTGSSIVPAVDLFPTVKPEYAKKYLQSPEGFGPWHIYISTSAIKNLRDLLRSDHKVYNIVSKKIMELSHGHFSGSNHKRLLGGHNGIPIYEAKMTSDLRLVYQIDLETSDDLKLDQQMILVYGVFTHAQFDHRLWERVGRCLPHTPEYRDKIDFRVTPKTRGVDVTIPKTWPHSDYITHDVPDPIEGITEDEFLELHELLSLEKFVRFSVTVLQSIMQNIDASHAFKVSPTEIRIINHPSSCFVIGRSGTGKTTTMLFKLLGKEYTNALLLSSEARYTRQVFLTQSHLLAQRVQEYYQQLVAAATAGSATSSSSNEHEGLFNLDEESDSRGDLPERFSELTDRNFPLFVTFDQIRRMLEKDLAIEYTGQRAALRRNAVFGEIPDAPVPVGLLGEVDPDLATNNTVNVPVTRSAFEQRMVTFDIFRDHYWPHVNQQLTKGLDVALVYSEILGVISGHEETLKTEEGYLSRETYLDLSTRAFAQFAEHREAIYDIFEKYRHLKREKQAYDSPERTHAIIRRMDDRVRNQIHFLYVDEVQDLLTVDTKLLRMLCENPYGLFWGGDSAQVIAQGSSFRFENLKALLYREELEDSNVRNGRREPVQAETFELLVNYRSHGGIVNCAGSVITLITTLFPNSIDKLRPESAVVTGPKPAVFRGWDQDTIHFESFIFGSKESRVDFGARQVILVRNDQARDRLREQVGDAGLILTLLESKGLEFDDVLIYGFFDESPASANQWRVILSVMNEPNAPRFDGTKHAVINSELKHLYVGITRARHHCWIWDSSESAEPIVKYWNSNNLIKIYGPKDQLPQFAAASTPEEYGKTGQHLFSKGLYAQAASLFEKADRPFDAQISMAYQKRKDARRIQSGPARSLAFKTAGEAFSVVAYEAEQKTAGRRTASRAYHTFAMECFIEAGETGLAMRSKAAAADDTEAAKMYSDLGDWDNALALVRPKRGQSMVDPGVASEIIRLARMEFLKNSRYSEASPLFDNLDHELEFVRLNGLRIAHKYLLKENGRREEAAKLHEYDGEFMNAATIWLESTTTDFRRQGITVLLHGLWAQTFGVRLTQKSGAVILEKRLQSIDTKGLSPELREEISIFNAILTQDYVLLRDLSRSVVSRDPVAAILCFDSILLAPPQFEHASFKQIITKLDMISQFVGLLLRYMQVPLMHLSPELARLTGFRRSIDQKTSLTADTYGVFTGSLLEKRIAKDHPEELPTEGEYHVLTAPLLDYFLKLVLELRIRSLLSATHENMVPTRLRPCLDMATNDKCLRVNCSDDDDGDVTIERARQRLRVHLQLITTLDHLRYITTQGPHLIAEINRLNVQRMWLERLHSIMFPVWYKLGNDQITPSNSVPEHSKTVSILRTWLNEFVQLLYSEQESTTESLLSSLLSTAMLASRLSPDWNTFRESFNHDSPRSDQVTVGGRLLVTDILTFYEWKSTAALQAGARFIHTVVGYKPLIDVNVFLYFVEHVSLEMTMNRRRMLLNGDAVYHDLLLPRSWILYLVRNGKTIKVQEVDLDAFFNSMRDLISNIFNWDGAGQEFTYDGKTSPRGAMIVKSLLVFRVCRLLVLLGYNILKAQNERNKILQVLRAFQNKPKHIFYDDYIRAKSWPDLFNALRLSMPPSETDQLILLEKDSNRSTTAIPNTKRITWKTWKHIEAALSFDNPPFDIPTVKPTPTPSTPTTSPSVTPAPTPSGPATANNAPQTPGTTNAAAKKKKKKKAKAVAAAVADEEDPYEDMPALESAPIGSPASPANATNALPKTPTPTPTTQKTTPASKSVPKPPPRSELSDDEHSGSSLDGLPLLIDVQREHTAGPAKPVRAASKPAPSAQRTPKPDFSVDPSTIELMARRFGFGPSQSPEHAMAMLQGAMLRQPDLEEEEDWEDEYDDEYDDDDDDDDDDDEPPLMEPKQRKTGPAYSSLSTSASKPAAPATTGKATAPTTSSSSNTGKKKISMKERFKRAIARDDKPAPSKPQGHVLAPKTTAAPAANPDSDEPPPLEPMPHLKSRK